MVRDHRRRCGWHHDKPERMATEAIEELSERELQVLKLVADGMSNLDIARSLTVTEHTAKKHVSSLLCKLGLSNRTQAAVYWERWLQGRER